MKGIRWFILLVLISCKVNMEPDVIRYSDFKKYHIQSLTTIQNKLNMDNNEFTIISIDSLYHNPKSRTITYSHNQVMPGCWVKKDYGTKSYLTSNYITEITIYYEHDNVVRIKTLDYKGGNSFADSLLLDENITNERLNSFNIKNNHQKITGYYQKINNTDSITKSSVFRNNKIQLKVYHQIKLKSKKETLDTTFYYYPIQGLQVIKEGNKIDSVFIKQNGYKKTIHTDTKYNTGWLYTKYFKKTRLWKIVDKDRKSTNSRFYYYERNKLTGIKYYRNDTLYKSEVYKYSKNLLSTISTYNYKCTTNVKKPATILGYDKFGNDSMARFRINVYDSVYYDYNVKPDITTYKYTFY